MKMENENSKRINDNAINKNIKNDFNKRLLIAVIIFAAITLSLVLFPYFQNRWDRTNEPDFSDDLTEVKTRTTNGWATEEDFAYWKDATFTIPEYADIPLPFQKAIVKIFLDNKYLTNEDDNQHFFTKIKDRAYRVIAYGDFTGQGEKEMAFILEKYDFVNSAIFIITEKGNMLYWKAYTNDLPTIKTLKKGESIYMDEMELKPSPAEGIIRTSKMGKFVLIYNTATKTFDEYFQYTKEEIESAHAITDGDVNITAESDTTEVD